MGQHQHQRGLAQPLRKSAIGTAVRANFVVHEFHFTNLQETVCPKPF